MNNTYKKNLKIALITYKFSGGGLEKVLFDLVTYLNKMEHNVSTIALEEQIINNNFQGNVFTLGDKNKINKYIEFNRLLKEEKFDYIIDFRYRLNPLMELIFATFFYKNSKTIYTVHSAKTETYFTKHKWIGKYIGSKCYKIVTVSDFIKNKIQNDYGFTNVELIHNGINLDAISNQFTDDNLPEFDYIIALGRFVKVKQFDALITTYSKSILPSKEIHLVLIGDGEEKAHLKQTAQNTNYSDKIHFIEYKSNPYLYIEKAKFLVLTSKTEGFPMVVLEALALGVPVISFNCESGPSEMINSRTNGLLVENQNFMDLLDKMNTFVLDEELYQFSKSNAKKSVAQFSMDRIGEKWLQILK